MLGFASNEVPNVRVDQLGVLVDDPMRSVRNSLERQIGHELLQTFEIARQQVWVLLAPDHERRNLDYKFKRIRGVVARQLFPFT